MSRRPPKNPHLKTLEAALAEHFGWQPGGAIRDAILSVLTRKADRICVDEVSYCRMASRSPGELNALAEEVAPGDTAFFRDEAQVEALAERVVPGLVAARAAEHRLRIWSAAASTGEEAYSLAILAREALPPDSDFRVEILATDLQGQAIVAASRGRYRASQIRGMDATLRNRYFIGVDEPGPDRAFDVLPLVRRLVLFRRVNLCDANAWRLVIGSFDLISCQNVLVYFHPRAANELLERLSSALAVGGYLVVAASEAALVTNRELVADPTLPAGFFRKADREPKDD